MLGLLALWACAESGEGAPPPAGAERLARMEPRARPPWVDVDAPTPVSALRVCPDGSGDAATLPEAIARAGEGATLTVCAGRHAAVDVSLTGRRLTLAGEPGAILDAGGAGRVLDIGPGAVVTLRGLVLTGGTSDTGGGLRCDEAVLRVERTTLRRNRAQSGGGLHARGCALTLTESRLVENEAGPTGDGGGAWLEGSVGRVEDTRLSGNVAHRGGGLAVSGGGFTLARVTLAANAATRFGGGAWLQGDVDVLETTVEDNAAVWSGGGLYLEQGAGTIADSRFTGNTTTEDGAGAILWNGTATFTRNLFRANVAEDDAGGLRLFESHATVAANTFEANVARHGDGGALKVSHAASVFVDNLHVENRAGGNGGAIEVDDDSSDVWGDVFLDNAAEGDGGALHTHEPNHDVALEGLLLLGNRAGGCGGAIGAGRASFGVAVRGSRAEGNLAARGGAVCWEGPLPLAPAPLWTGEGDGLLLVGNEADEGGALAVEGGAVRLAHTTLAGNRAARGAAVRAGGGTVTLTDAIVAHHEGVALRREATGTLDVARLLAWENDELAAGIADPLAQADTLQADPRFVDATPAGGGRGDWSLAEGSPARDAGPEGCRDPDGSPCDLGWTGGAWGGSPR